MLPSGSCSLQGSGSAAHAIQCATRKAFATSISCEPTPLPSLTAAPLTGDLRHATACIRRWPLPCLLSLSKLALPAIGVVVRCAGCPALRLLRSFLLSLGVAAGGHTDDLQAQTVWQGILHVHFSIVQSQAQMCSAPSVCKRDLWVFKPVPWAFQPSAPCTSCAARPASLTRPRSQALRSASLPTPSPLQVQTAGAARP